MPDPTPTPDTLRAAAQQLKRLIVLADSGDYEDRERGPKGWVLTHDLKPVLMLLEDALAASPAPTTDTPDGWLEREMRQRGGFVKDVDLSGLVFEDDGEPRPAAVTAPTDTPDERRAPSFHWTPCTCHPVRPAAVTAPREDERAGGPCPATCRLIQVHRHCPGDCSCVTFPYTEDRWPDAARWSASEVRP